MKDLGRSTNTVPGGIPFLRPAAIYRRRIMLASYYQTKKIAIDYLMIVHDYYLQNHILCEGI